MELTEDQMVEELAEIQKLARRMFSTGNSKPYDESSHEKACTLVTKKLKYFSNCSDFI